MNRSALQRLLVAALLSACSSTDSPSMHERAAWTPSEPLKVAACQIRVDGDRAATLERIDGALTRARELGAQIACFPEACLFGWVNPEAHAQADPIPGRTTVRLGELARKHSMMIAIGLAEQQAGKLHNAAVLIDLDGELLLHHRKMNILSELMDPPYTPGSSAFGSVADTRYGRIGMLICADTFLDPIVSQVAEAEPELMLVPYGWAAPAEAWPEHGESLHAWISHTARRTGAPTLGVDSTGVIAHGPWKGQLLGGQSAFSDASGTIVGSLADREAEVRAFDVQLTSAVPADG